jgi:hypothetical protein
MNILSYDRILSLKKSLLVEEDLLSGDFDDAKGIVKELGRYTPRWIRMIANGNPELVKDVVVVATLEYFQMYKERIAEYGSNIGAKV